MPSLRTVAISIFSHIVCESKPLRMIPRVHLGMDSCRSAFSESATPLNSEQMIQHTVVFRISFQSINPLITETRQICKGELMTDKSEYDFVLFISFAGFWQAHRNTVSQLLRFRSGQTTITGENPLLFSNSDVDSLTSFTKP